MSHFLITLWSHVRFAPDNCTHRCEKRPAYDLECTDHYKAQCIGFSWAETARRSQHKTSPLVLSRPESLLHISHTYSPGGHDKTGRLMRYGACRVAKTLSREYESLP